MKKSFLVLLASAFTFGAFAQAPESSSIKYDHWSLNLKGAADLMRDYGPHVKRGDRTNFGAGADLNYMFNPLWGISLDYLWSPYNQDPVNFKGHFNELALEGTIDLSNLLSPYRSTVFLKNFNLYANAGAGISFYHYSNPLSNSEGGRKSALVLAGLSAEYNLSKYFALDLGAEYRIHNKNDMESNLQYATPANTNDFLVATLGLRIKFGRKDGQHVRNMSYLEYAKQHTITEDSKLLPMVNSLNDKVNDLQKQVDDLNNRFNAYVDSNNKAMSDLEAKCLAKANTEVSNNLKQIHFAFGSAKIDPDSYAALDDLAEKMKDNSDWQLHLAGHTDWIGSKAYNQRLSEDRANSVKNYLVSKGVDASRISVEGFGKTRPIASNKTKAGRAKNRRVEFDTNK